MLDFQLVQAPFRFGVDEGTDPKQVPFGTLLRAENVVWKKSGKLQKRSGIKRLTPTEGEDGSITSGARLLSRGEELGVIDGNYLHSFTDNNGWVTRGRVPEVGIEWETVQETMRGAKAFDVAMLTNGNLVMAWLTGDATSKQGSEGRIFYQIVDSETGVVVFQPTQVGTLAGHNGLLRLVKSGTGWILVWLDDGDVKAYCRVGSGNATVTLATDARTTTDSGLDACEVGSTWVVAYSSATGGIILRRFTFANAPVEQANDVVTGESDNSLGSISVSGSSADVLFIAWAAEESTGRIRYATADPSTLAQVLAPVTVLTSSNLAESTVSIQRTSSTQAILAYSFNNAAEPAGVLRTARVDTSGTVADDRKTYFLQLLSRPTLLGTRYYALASNFTLADTFDPETAIPGIDVFLLDVTHEPASSPDPYPSRQVGKLELLTGGWWVNGYVANMAAISSTKLAAPFPYQAAAGTQTVGVRQGVRLAYLTIGASLPKDMWRPVQYGPETYITAGMFAAYDGVEIVGYGWPHGPYMDPDNTTAEATGGFMATGSYIYNVTAERRSAVGILHRSPTGVAITRDVTGPSGRVDLGIVPVSLGYSPYIVGMYAIYRSVADGAIPQRLTVEPDYNAVFNDLFTSQPVALSDIVEDDSISGIIGALSLAERPFIYTQGGELEDVQPVALVSSTIYRDRIFAIAGDRHTVWFTKSFAESPGTAAGFTYAFRIPFNDRLTGLAVLDERLVIFSENGIHIMAGDGPAPNGDNADYGSPNKLQTDVGCTNPRGIASSPMGTFFVSGNEIHILSRGLTVEWIGKPVQDLLDAYPNVTSAVLVPRKNHARFTCLDAAGTSGIVLVYDYTEKQWSHFIYKSGIAIADAIVHNDVYTILTTDGVVYQEDDATCLDDDEWVPSSIETAWVHAAGPLAYQSVRNFQIDGESLSAHGLEISVAFNGSSTWQQGPEEWAENIVGVTATGPVTAKVSIGTRRKCGSIRFRIEDVEPDTLGTGAGPSWSSMGIEVGVKKGLNRLALRQTG